MYSIKRWFHGFLVQLSIVIVSVWVAPDLIYGATYYVAKTGSDSKTCVQAQVIGTAKLTIAAGLACLTGGDTLVIGNGTYAEGINSGAIPSGISDSQRTTIMAQNPRLAILNGKNTTGGGQILTVSERSFITFDGIVFDGGRIKWGGNGPLYSHYITLQNSVVKNFLTGTSGVAQSCISQLGPGGSNTNLKYINNEVHDCGPETGHGIYLTAKNSLIERNHIYNTAGYGVHNFYTSTPNDASNNIIRYNYIHNTGAYGILSGSGTNNQVYGNIIKGGADPWGNLSSGGISAGFGNPSNIQIYNNTVYASNQCIQIRADATGTKVKNNLCLSNTQNTINNLGTNTTISNNRLTTDLTLVVDAQNNNFSPRAGSALIDAGDIIPGFSAGKFLGTAPDHGAVEFVPSSPPAALGVPLNLQVTGN